MPSHRIFLLVCSVVWCTQRGPIPIHNTPRAIAHRNTISGSATGVLKMLHCPIRFCDMMHLPFESGLHRFLHG